MALRAAITAGALAIVAVLFYGSRLSQVPAGLQPAEVGLARQAYSIAETGRDLDGRLLPIFVHSENEVWYPTVPAYSAVIAIAVAPRSSVAVRWPSVVFGTITVLLVYWIGSLVFGNQIFALLAAVLTLLTPALYQFSRIAADGVFALPFVLAALACTLRYLESRRQWLVWAMGLSLGAGFYSGTTAPLLMLVVLGLCALSLWLSGQRQSSSYLRLATAFVLPLLVLLPWFLLHPSSYPDTLGRWAIHAAHIRNPLDGLRAIVNWGSLTNRASVFWEFLNPAYLFFPAEQNSVSESTASGPMLSVLLLLLPLGVARILRTSSPAVSSLLLLSVFVSPLAAATFGEDHALGRVLVMMPLAALIATFGVEYLWSRQGWAGRTLAVILLALVPLQFAVFHAAYLGR